MSVKNEEDEDAPPLIWAAQARLGEKEEADRGLSSFAVDHPEQANPFYTKLDNFLLGKISEQDLLAAADSVDEKKRQTAGRSLVLRRPQTIVRQRQSRRC